MPPTQKSASSSAATGPQGGVGSDAALVEQLDALNLDQALVDFATANARVLDLTRRLCTLNEEVVALRDENVRQKIELDRLHRLEARAEALERSTAVRIAGGLRSLVARGRAASGR